MRHTELEAEIYNLRAEFAANRVLTASRRLHFALKQNPNRHLQPRIPPGNPDGGRWVAYLVGAASSLLPLLQHVGTAAVRRLRDVARRTAPWLRRLPRRWQDDSVFPADDSFDDETRRIGPPSWQRYGHPNIRFRTERELRDFLGPAGPKREWHHIVEKRLAENGRFPVEIIHSTDNIINLPVDVHRRINAIMSAKDDLYGGLCPSALDRTTIVRRTL